MTRFEDPDECQCPLGVTVHPEGFSPDPVLPDECSVVPKRGLPASVQPRHSSEARKGTRRSTGSEDCHDSSPRRSGLVAHFWCRTALPAGFDTVRNSGPARRFSTIKGKTVATPTIRMWTHQCFFTRGPRRSRSRIQRRTQQPSSSCSQPRLLPDGPVLRARRISTQAQRTSLKPKSQNARAGRRFLQANSLILQHLWVRCLGVRSFSEEGVVRPRFAPGRGPS